MIAPKCEHCRGQFAFGIFRLTFLKGGNTITRSLCADCGFNITTFRVMKHYEFEREVTPPTGKTRTVHDEAITQKFVYSECTLLETYMGTIVMAKEAQKRDQELKEQAERYAEAKRNTPITRKWGRGAEREPMRVLIVEKATPVFRQASVSSTGGELPQSPTPPSAPTKLPFTPKGKVLS